MGYLSATGVELNGMLPERLQVTPTSTPDFTSAQAFINGISAELDSAAAHAGYVTPISSTASYAYGLMQNFVGYGAAWRVLSVMMPNQGGPKDKVELSSVYRDAFLRALAGLEDGSISLIGAPEEGGGTNQGRLLPRSYYTSNPGASTGIIPQVSIDQVF